MKKIERRDFLKTGGSIAATVGMAGLVKLILGPTQNKGDFTPTFTQERLSQIETAKKGIGQIYICKPENKKLFIGDSFAGGIEKYNSFMTDIIFQGGYQLSNILAMCMAPEASEIREKQYSEGIYFWGGTADRGNFSEKLAGIRECFDYLENNFNGDVKILSPFPTMTYRSKKMAPEIEKALAKKYGSQHIALLDEFFEGDNYTQKKGLFIGEGKDFHLSEEGYAKIRDILNAQLNKEGVFF